MERLFKRLPLTLIDSATKTTYDGRLVMPQRPLLNKGWNTKVQGQVKGHQTDSKAKQRDGWYTRGTATIQTHKNLKKLVVPLSSQEICIESIM